MRYLGGKARIAKKLTSFLSSQRKEGQCYIEPFIGGGSVLRLMENPRIAGDSHRDLILFYKSLQSGWEPPQSLSEQEYQQLKDAEPSALRGFGLFFCSFGGKWKGGYARDPKSDRDFVKEAHRDALRLAKQIQDVEFYCASYATPLCNGLLFPQGSLIYCDPPYANTTKFVDGGFDNIMFWEHIRDYSDQHDIYTSEYTVPEYMESLFECVWEIERKTELNTKNGKATRIEKIFKLRDQ